MNRRPCIFSNRDFSVNLLNNSYLQLLNLNFTTTIPIRALQIDLASIEPSQFQCRYCLTNKKALLSPETLCRCPVYLFLPSTKSNVSFCCRMITHLSKPDQVCKIIFCSFCHNIFSSNYQSEAF